MLSLVVAAEDVRERGPGMALGGGSEDGSARVGGWKGPGDALHAPGTAQVEAVQMYDFGIRTIRNSDRL